MRIYASPFFNTNPLGIIFEFTYYLKDLCFWSLRISSTKYEQNNTNNEKPL
jgi:hypothetical protein